MKRVTLLCGPDDNSSFHDELNALQSANIFRVIAGPGENGEELERLEACRSGKLTDRETCREDDTQENGAGDRDRTGDIQLGKLAFYR